VTANLVVRREWFDKLRGFDETLPSGGDYEFVDRAVERGARLRYASRAVVRHPTIGDRRSFLRKIWTYNRWSAVRRARRGDRMDVLGVLGLVPVVGVAISRIRALRPPHGLSSDRLAAAGVTPTLGQHVRGLATLYCVVCYAAGGGRAAGWIEGWRRRRRGEQPRYSSSDANRPQPVNPRGDS
jgi:GT2 family glycosyltransferase